MGAKNEFSKEDEKKIVDMYKDGMSIVKIGKEYNCSRTPIKRVLCNYNITIDNVARKIPKEEYQNVIDLYNSGKTQKEIGKIYGCGEHVVSTLMKKLNVKARPNGFTKEDADSMYEMYQQGNTLDQIALMYDTNRHTVGKVFKRYNLVVDRKTYHCNEHYFDIIDDQNKAYIMGLLWADGCNDEKRGKIIIQLQEKDRQILEDVKNVVQSDMPLWFLDLHSKNLNWSNTYTLTLRSKHMSVILANYGMIARKSLVLEFPEQVDNTLVPHFIRGYMDGDGSIYYSQKRNVFRASMVGTKKFLEKVQEFCFQVGVKTSLYNKNGSNNTIYTLSTTSNIGTLIFLNWIYNDANLKMLRKYDKYQQFLNNINDSLAI